MSYNISVREFIEQSRSGSINYLDFITSFNEQLGRLDGGYLREFHAADLQPSDNLWGLPVSVKDCIWTQDFQTCAGSLMLKGFVAPSDATAVHRVREETGNIVGKTNQDEFGFGSFSVNCAYGKPKNPHDPERTCGGSSGGAAGLAAALDYPHIALAQSTGGSVSCPSAFCSVVGLTPTYGLVSRYGLVDYANSLDKIGPIGRCVHDVALMLSVIAGYDPSDSTSLRVPQKDYTAFLGKSVRGMTAAVPKEYLSVSDKVSSAFWDAVGLLEKAGVKVRRVSLPSTALALSAYYIIASAEASTNLAKYCGLRYGLQPEIKGSYNSFFASARSSFGKEAKRRIMLGTFARSSGYRDQYYAKAMAVRSSVIDEFRLVLKKHDVILSPTMPFLPPKFSEIRSLSPLQHYQADILTVPHNLAGLPSISVPCGRGVGLHIISGHLKEDALIRFASAFESLYAKQNVPGRHSSSLPLRASRHTGSRQTPFGTRRNKVPSVRENLDSRCTAFQKKVSS